MLKKMEKFSKVCTKCKIDKLLTEFRKSKFIKDGRKSACTVCLKQQWKEYYDNNLEKESTRKKVAYIQNREQIISKSSTYNIQKRKVDPIFRLKHNIRKRIRAILLSKRLNKNNTFTKYIGCSLPELKTYIEKQFQSGMTWANYGEWEIDHIIPLSRANTSEELYQLNHYMNLQPLWKSENRSKSNR